MQKSSRWSPEVVADAAFPLDGSQFATAIHPTQLLNFPVLGWGLVVPLQVVWLEWHLKVELGFVAQARQKEVQ